MGYYNYTVMQCITIFDHHNKGKYFTLMTLQTRVWKEHVNLILLIIPVTLTPAFFFLHLPRPLVKQNVCCCWLSDLYKTPTACLQHHVQTQVFADTKSKE